MRLRTRVAAAAVSVFMLSSVSGCGSLEWFTDLALPEDAVTDAGVDEANNMDTDIELHIRLYDANGQRLPGATVSVQSDATLADEDVTNDNGVVTLTSVPTNTELKYTIKDSSGTELGTANVFYNMNSEYENMIINAAAEIVVQEATEDTEAVTIKRIEIDLPTTTSIISAAMCITSDGNILTTNLSSYQPSDELSEEQVQETLEGTESAEQTAEEAAAAEAEAQAAAEAAAQAEAEAAAAAEAEAQAAAEAEAQAAAEAEAQAAAEAEAQAAEEAAQ